MTGSWLCLPLLLVGALLLGQPAWGAEQEEFEELPEEQTGSLEEGHLQEEAEESREHMALTSYEEREALENFEEEGDPINFEALAVDYFNKHQHFDDIYRSVASKHPTFKDAIGTIVHMKMLLAKTDCKKKEMGDRPSMIDIVDHFHLSNKKPLPELKGCNLPPPDEQENLSCNFRIFMNARSGLISVIHHKCRPFHVRDL